MAVIYGLGIAGCVMTGRRVAHMARDVSDSYDHVTTVVQENVAGARVVRAFGKEPAEVDKFGDRMDDMTKGWADLERYWTGVMPGVNHLYYLSLPLVLLLGLWRVSEGLGGITEVTMVLLACRLVHHRIRPLTRLVIVGQQATASASRVFEVLDRTELIPPPAEPRELPAKGGRLEIEGVHFAHNGDLPVLKGVSLEVPAGGSLGIIGPTGAGKSTLVQLLPRFYDPDAGAIRLDGIDLRELDVRELRKEVGLVFQEPFLFSGTVTANVGYGKPGTSFEEIQRCVDLAAGTEFVEALPKGYETVIGERGVSLSGGQRQRLTIARALAMDPRVLVFDDATASVDAVTERRLFRGIREGGEGPNHPGHQPARHVGALVRPHRGAGRGCRHRRRHPRGAAHAEPAVPGDRPAPTPDGSRDMSASEIELEEEFAKTSLKRATFRRLLVYFKPHTKSLLIVMALEVLWVISMLIDPRLVRSIVDGSLATGDFAGGAWLCALMAVNIILRAITTTIELRMSTRIGVYVLDAVRRDVFDHIQRLSMRYFDRTKQGRIIARADRDVETLEHLIFWGPIMITMMLLSISLATIYLVTTNAQLALYLVIGVPCIWFTTRVFHRFGFSAYRRVREAQSAISAHVAECITGVRVVQAFNAEPREVDGLEEKQGRYRFAVMRGAKIAAAYLPSLGLTFHTVLILILFTGGAMVVDGTLTAGGLLEFVLLMGFVLGPVEGLGGLYNECLVAGARRPSASSCCSTRNPKSRTGPTRSIPGGCRGRSSSTDVSFSYDPSGSAGLQLENVSFRVSPGETIALVGHTGAGKTSVINLLARFYEAQHGEVRLDGIDIRKVPLAALHAQTGIVLQSNFLFAGSVLDNLRFVHPGLTAEEARQGFEELGCAGVLEQFPKGLDSDVGERGANLSEGERQIVCFVRALLSDPSILILDEATSAVDTRTEALILEALRRLAAHQTTVVIAHRLSTIKDADRILVMEQGKVVEQGTHGELLAKDGTYAHLYSEYGA